MLRRAVGQHALLEAKPLGVDRLKRGRLVGLPAAWSFILSGGPIMEPPDKDARRRRCCGLRDHARAMVTSGQQTANNISMQNIVSRLSKLQREIVTFLATRPEPRFHRDAYDRDMMDLREVPTPSEMIDALGRERNPSNYAVVSRALQRLQRRGLVARGSSEVPSAGRGYRYWLTAEGRTGHQRTFRDDR